MKKILGVKRDVAVATALEVNPNKLYMWKKRNFIPYELLVPFAEIMEVRLDWLLTGEGPMEREKGIAEEMAKYGLSLDDISARIVLLLKDMPEEARRELLRSLEEKKLLRELIEERKKLKDAG